MKTYIVIYNQNSRGKKYKKEELEKKFIEHDLIAKIFVTKQINEVDLVIKEFTDSKKYVYIGIGGDGTLNSLINSLLNNKITLPEVACISSGSGSDFLRTFAMPNNIDEAILRIKNDENYLIDTALIKSSNKSNYFINVLNYGFLAETVNLSEKLPIIFKRFRYPLSFWLKLVTGKQSLFVFLINFFLSHFVIIKTSPPKNVGPEI